MRQRVRPALIMILIPRRVQALFETLATVFSLKESVHRLLRAQKKLNKILFIMQNHLLVT